jgi:polyhydroxyalkanoate synthesis regulator phasin
MTLSVLDFSKKALMDIDHDYFVFFDSNNTNYDVFTTYPQEWQERYFAQNYQANDYGLLKSTFLPFTWGEKNSNDISLLQKQIFKEAQDLAIFKGITVPFSTSGYPGALTIAFNKGGKIPQSQFLKQSADLHFACRLLITYKDLVKQGDVGHEAALKLIHELATWQKDCQRQKEKHAQKIMEALSDIRAAQMFIMQHETKDLGLETLHRAYKDVERLI